MAPIIRIVRVKRTDSDEYILLHVTQASQTRPLDVKLVATDHEHIYHGSLKGSDVAKQKADQFSGSDDDLKDILVYTFMRDRIDGSSPDLYSGIETVAKLQKDTIQLTIRKNISGITQRVFATSLVQDDEREELSPFEWVDTSVAITDEVREELQSVQQTATAQQAQITALQARLDEFIKAKKEHDDDMLQKFAALLNTKKRKIRDLRHRLDQANIVVDDEMEDVKEEAVDEQPVKSRGRGRKRKVQQEDNDVEMNDAVEEEHDETPQQTDEDEDDLNAVQTSTNNTQGRGEAELPPRRELPFANKASRKTTPPVTRSQDAEPDDDETDDEFDNDALKELNNTVAHFYRSRRYNMPPKKASQQVYLVVDQYNLTSTVRVVEAYTTEEAANGALEHIASDPNGGDYGNLGVISVELKTSAPASSKKSTKATTTKVASRGKTTKNSKAQDDDDEDDDNEEQDDDSEKKPTVAEKRKQIVEGDANALSGLKLLFTGTFQMDRKTCEATAVKAGATIVSTMKQANYVVLGTKPGPKKVAEIEENGYQTWDEELFLSKVQGADDNAGGAKKKKASQ